MPWSLFFECWVLSQLFHSPLSPSSRGSLVSLHCVPLGWCHLCENEVAQSCPTLCNPLDCSPLGSSVHGIFQARILEWVAIFFSRGSSQPSDRTRVSRLTGRCFTVWATRECSHPVWYMQISSAYLRLLIFLLAVLIPACASSSPAFHMMYSASVPPFRFHYSPTIWFV